MVATALENGGHTVRVVDGNMNVIEELKDFMPRVVAGERPGMVFNMAYGIQGVSRYTHVPAMLEMLGVPYVGSGPVAHGLALDKVIAKMMFQSHGLPTAGFWNFASPDDHFDDLVFPVIVKPKMEAVSFGISIVDNWTDLREAVSVIINEFQQHVLVEQFVSGREFAVGLLGNGDPEILPIVEIDLEGDPDAIQSAEDKLSQPRNKLCPAPLSDAHRESIESITLKAFQALDLKDFARVDYRMDSSGNPYILEINSMASLGRTGTYVHAAQTAGYAYESLINKMLEVAAVRYFGIDYEGGEGHKVSGTSGRQDRSARIRTYLRSESVTTEDTLRKLVEVHTPSREVEAVNGLGEWLKKQLKQIGFEVQDRPRVDVGNVLYFRNHKEATNDVLLLAHLDTAAGSSRVPFQIEGNRIRGTGVAECKGGIAVAMSALRALRFVRRLRNIRCALLITSDGGLDGGAARQLVEDSASESRYVLGLKAGDLDGSVVTSRAGRATYRLESTRRRGARAETTAHAAVSHFCGRMLALQDLDDEDAGVRVAVTRMELAAAFGKLPHLAQAQLTVRFNAREDADRLDAKVRQLADQRAVPGFRLAVSGSMRRPPLVESDESKNVYERVSQIASRLHMRISSTHRWSSADVCFVAPEVPVIDGLGPLGSGERTDDEYIIRSSLVERGALLAELIHALSDRGTDAD